MPPILLTGFDPFDNATVNPSWCVARALAGQRIAGHQVVAAQLPTAFGQALPNLHALLQAHRPALVLCLGLAAGRAALSIERIGINVIDARIPDNQGAQPVDMPVVPHGPAAYFATLPIKAMLRAVRQSGIAAEVSQSAGTFVCNQVLYGLLHLLHQGAGAPGARGGFIHVPQLPEQGLPGMPLRDMVRGVYTALWAAALARHDIPLHAGTEH
ncbi:MAG: pyroglutamyl-peptidase I [Paenacidovorax caeni]